MEQKQFHTQANCLMLGMHCMTFGLILLLQAQKLHIKKEFVGCEKRLVVLDLYYVTCNSVASKKEPRTKFC